MTIELPVEPGLLLIFAKAVGDDDPTFRQQLSAEPGEPVIAPLTFTRAVAQHFDVDGDLRLWPGGEPTAEGGAGGQFHAEQHFEYLKPLRAGDRLTGRTYVGRTWSKQGRAGTLDFGETITDFTDARGELAVRTRKVGVRVRTEEGHD